MPTPPTFDGILNTPDKMLVFFDANEPKFASLPVPAIKTRIRVWIAHPTQPEMSLLLGDRQKQGVNHKACLISQGRY